MDTNRNPEINTNLCDNCGICVENCTENALHLEKQGPVFNSPNTCTYCAICEEICPLHAIRVPYTVSWKA